MPTCTCCAAARNEFKSPMFTLVEYTTKSNDKSKNASLINGNENNYNNNRLDIVRTFSPKPRLVYLGLKLFLTTWIVSVMVSSIMDRDHPEFWIAYLTHWGFTVTTAYFLMSCLLAIYLAVRPGTVNGMEELEGCIGLFVKITWALFAIAVPAEVVITILFWVLEFDGTVDYISVMVHGVGTVLLVIDGFLLGRIPLRMKQFLLFEAFSASYLLWNVIHAYSGIGNPYEEDGTQSDDAIYASLAWRNDTRGAAILTAGVLVVGNPVVFLVCRGVSRLFPRRLREDGGENMFRGGKQNDEEAGMATI
mmetsp:Transcript_19534/g.42480  ORF Transcript_19534/g.42480 Transcript_19534/m.42480 type:complete len:306 (-) Transcript_19534:468-1385(-)